MKSGTPLPADRTGVEQTVRDLVDAVVQGRVPGVSVAVEGAPGIGKTVLAAGIADAARAGPAAVVRLAGQRGRRNDPFAGAEPLLAGRSPDADPGEAAFDRIDDLCGKGPVLLWADDAHNLDGPTLTLLRRLVRSADSLPLAVLVTSRPYPLREPAAALLEQVQVRLVLPPMGPMLVERLVYDRTGRWPGPALRGALAAAAGNPLFAVELLRAHQAAGALAEVELDLIEARFALDLRATGIDELIQAHLRQLDDEALDMLAATAVWGTDIAPGDLARLLRQPADALAGRLTRSESAGLIRRDTAGTVGFVHERFRELVYDQLPGPRRRELHRAAAALLAEAGHRPTLVADHLVQAAGSGPDAALVAALESAVSATSRYAPEVASSLLGDLTGRDAAVVPESLVLAQAEALFRQGRGETAEALVRTRLRTVTDPAVATRMQQILITSLATRAEVAAFLEVVERTVAITGLPAGAVRRLEALRAWIQVTAGQGPSAAEMQGLLARFAAAGDTYAQSVMAAAMACARYQSGQPGQAIEELTFALEQLGLDPGDVPGLSSALYLPAVFALSATGPAAAWKELDRARRIAAERQAPWVTPFLEFAAGGIAFAAGDWDDAAASLDAALEQAAEAGTGWISLPVAVRAYIDAHRGRTAQARARLESFRHRGLPLQFGYDRPGWAELAVLEAEGAIAEAATLARTLWSAARGGPSSQAGDLAVDAARVALAALDRRLSAQLAEEVAGVCPPAVSGLVRGMLASDRDAIEEAAVTLAAAGQRTLEAFAREELACAAAAAGDRAGASAALEAALAGYEGRGAVPDRDRALARARALGLRRGTRPVRREAAFGWEALTETENRVARLVCDGLTNREIASRLFVSPRTVQTHVSHILQKTGLRSRVEIARFAAVS